MFDQDPWIDIICDDASLQNGFVVCILFGDNVPSILRPVYGYYLSNGGCYVYGLMKSEAVDQLEAVVFREE